MPIVRSNFSMHVRGCSASVLVSNLSEVNGNLIRQTDPPSFLGAKLIFTPTSQSSIEQENLAYTIKEVNAFFNMHEYVVATYSLMADYPAVMDVWPLVHFLLQTLLMECHTLYHCSCVICIFPYLEKSAATYLTPWVKVFVIGLFSVVFAPTDGVRQTLLNFGKDDPKLNFFEWGRNEGLCEEDFFTTGARVLDLSGVLSDWSCQILSKIRSQSDKKTLCF